MAVAADQSAQIAAPVVGGVAPGARRSAPVPISLLFERQVRPPAAPCSVPVTCFQPRSLRKRWSPLATSSVPSSRIDRGTPA